MESSKIGIEKFDGSDFSFWKMQIEDYLYQKDLHEPLSGVKPESMKEEHWKLKDRQALGLIRLTLSRNVAFNIVKEKTTANLLKALANMYEKPSAMNKVYLMRRLFNLQMKEGGSVANHINDFNMIVSQLSSVEINFDDEVKALILMSSLPDSWDSVVVAISSSRGSEKVKFDEIRDIILSESIRKREIEDSSGSALSVDQRGRSKSKGQSTHDRSKSRGKSPRKSKGVVCWNCGEKGHIRTECKKPKKKQNHNDNDSVNSAEDVGDALILSVDSPLESWILDSGASFHSSSSKELFRNFKSEISRKFILLKTILWRFMEEGMFA